MRMTVRDQPSGLPLLPQSVLVIDDSLVQRRHTVRLCHELGVGAVHEASNGQEALALLEQIKPQLLIIDIEMPTMDGPQLLSQLHGRGIDIPIVLSSSRDLRIVQSVQHLAKALGFTVVATLQKPVDEPRLRKVLAGLLEPHIGVAAPEVRALVDEGSLHKAIQDGQLVLQYQPQVEINSGAVRGVEALVRWLHPQAQLIPPDLFIPLAENSGLIHPLTLRVLNDAMLNLVQWQSAGLELTVSVNISPVLLNRVELVDEIVALTSLYGLAPEQLILEITESSLVEMAHALEVLTRLRLRGYGLSLDDYGTGYSSMQQLAQIPFSELKIDRAFVLGVATQRDLQAMVRSEIAMAHELGLTTVAEGVENERDLQFLRDCGCTVAQGWLFSTALPATDLPAWVKQRAFCRAVDAIVL